MQNKNRYRVFPFLLLLALLFSGCGSDNHQFVLTNPSGGAAPLATARIRVNSVLARSIPTSIDSLRFTGVDASGQALFGPETRVKAATIILESVPLTVRTLLIEYLDNGRIVGQARVSVNLSANETLTIEDPVWANVETFGAPAALRVALQPTVASPGSILAPALEVAVEDSNGILVQDSTAAVTVSVSQEGSDSSLQGTRTVRAVGGVATFRDLSFTQSGTFTLKFQSGQFTASANDIVVTATPTAARLSFTQQPSNAIGSLGSVGVQVLDQFGNPFPGFTGPISLALGNNPTGARILGSLVVSPTNGQAVFDSLLVTRPSDGYTLLASASGLGPARSNEFTTTVGDFNRRAYSLAKPLSPSGEGVSTDTADFNADGKIDVVVGLATSNDIYILLQTNEGDFSSSRLSTSVAGVVKVGDFNNDGRADLVALSSDDPDPKMLLLLGNGDGTFQNSVSTALTSVTSPTDLEVADLNDDDLDDVVLAAGDGSGPALFALLSSGTGLGSPIRTGLSTAPAGLGLGELNGGGSADAAVAVGSSLALLEGNGDGTFTAGPSLGTPGSLGSVSLADFDGDNQMDVAVLGDDSGGGLLVHVFLNQSGAFNEAPGSPLVTGSSFAATTNDVLATGDFNQDQVPDVAFVNYENNTIGLSLTDQGSSTSLLSQPDFFPATSPLLLTFQAGIPPTSLIVGDLNGDGLNDLGLSSLGGPFVRLNGDGTGQLLPRETPASRTLGVARGDMDGQNGEDLVVFRLDQNDSTLGMIDAYLRQSNGTLPNDPSTSIQLTGLNQSAPGSEIHLADLDRDQDLDVMVSLNNRFFAFTNDGNGQLSPAPGNIPNSFLSEDAVELGDLNGDDVPDLAFFDSVNKDFTVAVSGAPFDYSLITITTTSPVEDIKMVDLDRDGDLDIVTAQGALGIGVFENDQGPSDEILLPIPGVLVSRVGAADLTGDDYPEIVAASARTGTEFGKIHVLPNDPNMGPQAPLEYASPGLFEPSEVLVEDANGDGVRDIIVGDRGALGAAILVNTGNGRDYVNGSLIHSGGEPSGRTSLVFFDLDNDNRREPVFATSVGGTAFSLLTLLALLLVQGLWRMANRRTHRAA